MEPTDAERPPLAGGPVEVEEAPSPTEPIRFGERVRDMRRRNGWTLEEMSRKTGIGKSTLSKIENDLLSPTFETVQRIASGLQIEIPQLFTPTPPGGGSGRRVITRAGSGKAHPTLTYDHELLCTELSGKRMVPYRTRVRARSLSEFGGWIRHDGEEFLYVLEGTVRLFTEHYEPTLLSAGDSAYYDSSMGHAVVSVSEEDAVILWLSTPW